MFVLFFYIKKKKIYQIKYDVYVEKKKKFTFEINKINHIKINKDLRLGLE